MPDANLLDANLLSLTILSACRTRLPRDKRLAGRDLRPLRRPRTPPSQTEQYVRFDDGHRYQREQQDNDPLLTIQCGRVEDGPGQRQQDHGKLQGPGYADGSE